MLRICTFKDFGISYFCFDNLGKQCFTVIENPGNDKWFLVIFKFS